jgi:hypothetical protein
VSFERFTLRRLSYTPGNVKLWESPGRAGGLPMIITQWFLSTDYFFAAPVKWSSNFTGQADSPQLNTQKFNGAGADRHRPVSLTPVE